MSYDGYVYSYPHKSAYRPLDPPVPLREAWKDEDKSALFLYVHVPYCEMRCGFCNLFARSNPKPEELRAYLDALRRQAAVVREALGPARFAQMAIGGGTPTYLGARGMSELLDVAGVDGVPISVETSPGTADSDVLRVLRERGVGRVSIGIQSFHDAELAAVGRPERADPSKALDALREFPTLNIDLIYGIPGQTDASWTSSLRTALRWSPEELYLYPLYIRPRTGMSKMPGPGEDRRPHFYRLARSLLLEAGYRQESMRQFRRLKGPDSEYSCQDDGMVGLGPGARSYTRALHYSTPYAVTPGGVREILERFGARDYGVADYGIALDAEEQRRRWLLKSLLRAEGFAAADYIRRFGPLPAFPPGWVEVGERVRLTETGLERSDEIGPGLYSPGIVERMEAFVLR